VLNGDSVIECSNAGDAPTPCNDVVRGLLVFGDEVITLDEGALLSSARGVLQCASAEDGSFLCCCVLPGRRVAVGTSTGRVHDRRLAMGKMARPAAGLVVGRDAVLALASLPSLARLLLVCTDAGQLLLVDLAARCTLRALERDVFGELRAECVCATAGPGIAYSGADHSDAQAHSRFAVGGGGVEPGRLVCLAVDDSDSAAAIHEWDAVLEAPVYAVAALRPAVGSGSASGLIAAASHNFVCTSRSRFTQV
jgi:hypothetical protein